MTETEGFEPDPSAELDLTPPQDGATLIAAERRRQVEAEGWTPEHDAKHVTGSLAQAAACYAIPPAVRTGHNRLAAGMGDDRGDRYRWVPLGWPWHPDDWKPTSDDRIRELVKAGALIAAEIDRLMAQDRAESRDVARRDAGTGNARGDDGRGPENCAQPRAGDAP